LRGSGLPTTPGKTGRADGNVLSVHHPLGPPRRKARPGTGCRDCGPPRLFRRADRARRRATGMKFSLERLSEVLQTEHRKHAYDGHGDRITADYLDYALNDTQATWECFAALRARYARFGLSKPIYQLYSGASFIKAHLQDMGIQPWRQLQ